MRGQAVDENSILFSKDEIQQRLPSGLLLDRTVAKSPFSVTFAALDQRLSDDPPLRRIIRVVAVLTSDPWRAQWLKRVQCWATNPLPHVACPLETGWLDENHAFLIFDKIARPLRELIPEIGGIRPKIAWRLIGQLMRGLSRIHAELGPHGGLRCEHLYVDTDLLLESTQVLIGDFDEGSVAWWSSNAYIAPGAADTFPPEWDGRTSEPSRAADVYALGYIACELLLTPAEARQWRQSAERPPTPRGLGKRVNWLWRWGWFQKLLSSEPRLRFADAPAAQLRWDRIGFGGEVATWTVGLAFALAAIIGVCSVLFREPITGNLESKYQRSEQRANSAERELAEYERRGRQADADLTQKQQELVNGKLNQDHLVARVQELQRQIPKRQPSEEASVLWQEVALQFGDNIPRFREEVNTMIAGQTDPAVKQLLDEWNKLQLDARACVNNWFTAEQRKPNAELAERERACLALRSQPWVETLQEQVARSTWNDLMSKRQSVREGLEYVRSALGDTEPESGIAVIPAANTFRTRWLEKWDKATRSRDARWLRWKAEPQVFLEEAAKRPWDETAVQDSELELRALNGAETLWRSLAARDLSWADFCQQLLIAGDSRGNHRIKTVLSRWIHEFSTLGSFDIELIQGRAPAGWGQFRRLEVFMDASKSLTLSHELEWDDERAHSFVQASLKCPIDAWKPGQKIILRLYGQRYTLRGGLRPCLIDQTFDGPVALWRLHQAGAIAGGEHLLEMRINRCPGPPGPSELDRMKHTFYPPD